MNETKNTLKSLLVIHKAMLMGQVIFAAIALFLKYTESFPSVPGDIDRPLQVIAVIISFGGFFVGSFLFKKRLKQMMNAFTGVAAKSKAYRSACIIQWALLEGASLFCICCFLVTGNYAYLALSVVLMLVFAATSPSKLKVMLMMQITEEEMETF